MKQKDDNEREFKKTMEEYRNGKYSTQLKSLKGIIPEEDWERLRKDEYQQKINELRLNATIITLEIQLLQKKIAEARINEL